MKKNGTAPAAVNDTVHCAHDALVDPVSLTPHPRNPNRHPDRQVKLLARIIKHQGWRAPIVVSKRSGFIVAGHARLAAAHLLGVNEVPVNYQNFKSEADEYAHLVADNRIAELADMNAADLKSVVEELAKIPDFDIGLTGFEGPDLDKLLTGGVKKNGAVNAGLEGLSTELEGAFALKDDMFFESKAKYGIPELRTDKLLGLEKGQSYGLWMGDRQAHVGFDHWLYVWGDSSYGLDLSKTIVGFYAEDDRFDCFWFEAPEYAARLLNAKIQGVLTPNYSLWTEWPTALKIYNIYRARWVGRYWQEAGMSIIPDVEFGKLEDFEFCLEGTPKNAPALAIQTHAGESTVEYTLLKKRSIERVINELKPQSLLLYASSGYEQIIDGIIPKELYLVVVESRVSRLTKIVKSRPRAI